MSDSPALSAWPQLAGGDLALGDCDCCLSTGGGGLILAGSVQLRFSGFEEGRQGSGVGMTASGRSLVGTPSPTSTPVGAPARRPIYGICKFAFSVAWFTHGNWTFHLNVVKAYRKARNTGADRLGERSGVSSSRRCRSALWRGAG